jgi:hypothetical protein
MVQMRCEEGMKSGASGRKPPKGCAEVALTAGVASGAACSGMQIKHLAFARYSPYDADGGKVDSRPGMRH